MQTVKLDKLDSDTELLVSRGREAWRTLRADETWEKWVAIGRALEAGRTAIMRQLHTNQPKGKRWSETFGAWLRENDFDEIDKGVRSRLQTCLENLPAIEAWRQTLGLTLRLQLNHPNAVLRRWQATHQAPKGTDGAPDRAPPGPTPGEKLRQENMRLQEELDAAEAKIRQLQRSGEHVSEGRDWSWHDTPQEIAAAMLRLYPDKAKRVGAALQNLAKPAAAKKPAKPRATTKAIAAG
jgi:hypothetical protein